MDIFVTSQLGAVVVFLLGAAGLLGLGSLALLFVKHSAFKQRIAEVTVFITATWILLAFIPFPRWSHTARYGSVSQSPSMVASVVALAAPKISGREATDFTSTLFEPAEQVLALPISAQHLNTDDEAKTVVAAGTTTTLSLPEVALYGYVLVSACLLAWVILARVAMAIACMRWQRAPECPSRSSRRLCLKRHVVN